MANWYTGKMETVLNACQQGNFDTVKCLVNESNRSLVQDYADSKGCTCLFWACWNGNLSLVKWLINYCKCSPNCRNHHRKPWVHTNYEAGLYSEPGVDYLDRSYSTPLHIAACQGHMDIVDYLVSDAKCDLNCQTDGGNTPLTLASEHGHLDVVEYLHKCGRTQHVMKALKIACRKGHLHIAKYLIKYNPQCIVDTGNMTPLHEACFGGHLSVVKFLVEEHPYDPECTIENGLTPLHLACNYGHLAIAKYLITEQNARPHCTSDTMTTPLHSASWSGNLDLVQFLINEQQCDPCCENISKRTPLHYACLSGQLEVVKYLNNHLLEHQLNPESSDTEGNRPLHLACKYGHLHLVQYLVNESNRSLVQDYADSKGCTCLFWACWNGNLSLVKWLINYCKCSPNCRNHHRKPWVHTNYEAGLYSESGVDYLDRSYSTPLHIAAYQGHMDIVDYLVSDAKCDLNCQTDGGNTPLTLASEHGHLDVVEYLHKCGRTQHVMKALKIACRKGHLHIAKYLIKYNPQCIVDTGNMTPLHEACFGGHLSVVKFLVEEHPYDPECTIENGLTPLHLACNYGHLAIAKYLITEQNASPHRTSDTMTTPLHSATWSGNLELVKYLINEQQCDPCCENISKRTPLHYACLSGQLEVVKYLNNHLLEHQLNPESSDTEGNRPLHLACKYGHLHLVQYLVNESNRSLVQHYADSKGCTCLFWACLSGNLNLVKWLINYCKCSPNCRNHHGKPRVHTNCEAGLYSDPGIDDLYKSYSTPLHIAAFKGYMNIVDYLVSDAKCDLNCQTDGGGHTPLSLASEHGHLDVVEYLHKCGRTQLQHVRNALTKACRKGHLHIAKYLIKYNPQCIVDTGNMTPLHEACFGGHLSVVKFLVEEHPYDPECTIENGLTPLHLACNYGHLATAKYLITEQNASPHCTSDTMTTPLHSATWSGNLELVKYLINEQQCDPCCENTSKRTPLHYACLSGQLEIVKYLNNHLLEHQLNPESSDTEGNRPLHLACKYGHLHLVQYFVEVHCEVPSTSSRSRLHIADCIVAYKNSLGQTPLHLACLGGHSHVVEHLVMQCNCSPNCPDETGMTPLHIASKMGDLNLVKCLFKHPHCNSNSQTKSGYTPLHFACEEGHLSIVEYIISKNSDPECATHTNSLSQTPLHLACLGGHSHVVEHLVTECNCSPNCSDETGMTPLHIVSTMGDLKLVKCLFKHPHCNPNPQTKSGYTPLHFACEEGHLSIVEYFVTDKCSDPECETIDGNTPFMLACSSDHEDVAKFLLPQCDPLHSNKKGKCALVKSPAIRKVISDFYKMKKKHPIESYIKIFVLGDPEAGKSTLVQALQSSQSLINLLIARQVPENKVSKQTSGIDTFTYKSKSFGNVVIYDFAGQYEYYTSNAAFLQSFTSKSPGAVFLLVINANMEISPSLCYWLSFITDNWAHTKTKAHVFIVGSHADKVQGDIEKVYSTIEKVAYMHDADYRHAGVVCLDCRCQSSELGHLCTRLAEECTKLRTDTIDGRCYVLYDYIQCTYLKQTCTLLELTQSLHDHPFLPSDPNDMLKLVKLLHDKGQVILLEDCKNPASSWVIDNVQLLLKTVVGTVFAPTDFKNHLQVPNEIGIVSQEQILEVFEGIEISLIIGFLEHFQFCHKVDPTSLGLDEKSTYFFPALVTKSRPTIVRNEEHLPHVDYHCVWCMQCSRQDNDQPKFLPARWLHVVLLQLAYKFVLPLEDRPHSIAEESVNLSSRSKIWKNGIFWCNEAGICTLFEATEHMHTVILIMSCPSNHEISCVKLRSELIHTILTAVEDICPQNTKDLREYIIDPVNPAELYNKQQLASNLYGVSIQSLVRNLVKERKFWEFPDPMETTRELLYFEPYIVFSQQAVEQLFSKENSQKVVSTEFIAQLALWASHYDDNNALQKIIRPYPHEIVDEDSFTVCKQTLESWKHRSGSKYATYQKLCHELGNYSIFKGRDPFVSY